MSHKSNKPQNKVIVMKDFKSIIGGDTEAIKNVRVQNCVNNVLDESRMGVMEMRKEYRRLLNERENILDLGATSTTDIASNLKNIDPMDLVKKLNANAEMLVVTARKLKIRVKQHNILFPDNKEEDLTKDEMEFLEGLV